MIALPKEHCQSCQKNISIGQSISECYNCKAIIHTKCYNKSEFEIIENSIFCKICSQNVILRYNPFKTKFGNKDSEDDRFYNHELTDVVDTINTMSNILEKCKCYELITELNNINEFHPTCSNFSSLFLNIDGNSSNFDSFLVHIQQLNHKPSIIALAETNTNPELKNIYPIEGYNSFYQDTLPGKFKGTGVALYVNDTLNAVHNKQLSHCSPNLESLFLNITHGNEHKTTVGVIYRPPSGDATEFNHEFKALIDSLPKNDVYLLGDFNFDLHKLDNEQAIRFEETILTSGLSPLISLYTHAKPNCRTTCIDNILTNVPDKIICSGTISDNIAHHLPIFHISSITHISNKTEDLKTKIEYEFSNRNINQFRTTLTDKLISVDVSDITFSSFNHIFNEALNKSCKLTLPRFSKRNRHINPWITEGIITSVNYKQLLF